MTIAEHLELARHLVPPPEPAGHPRVVTFGPGEEDWAVLDAHGALAYVGPALFAVRYAATLDR
jgi:hypothetical protein